jgi:hypothetical protein
VSQGVAAITSNDYSMLRALKDHGRV